MAGKENEKVVSIRFDNAEVKRKIQETIVALDQLSAKLNKPFGVDSFSGISAAASKVDFTPIVASVDSLIAKFFQFGDIASTILLDIATKASQVGPIVSESFGDINAAASRVDMTPMTASLDMASAKFGSFSATSGQALADVNAKAESLGPSVAASIGDMSSAVGRFSMEPIATSIEGINTKFLAMATIAVTSLQRIVDKAIDAGTSMMRSLTIDPVSQGFAEYELKMGSIQTIMAGSGASLEVVNQKLQELNEYSDRTIYSFADMTSNIGKFTNAGVSLDGAVAAIQGVANVAAVSGANAEEASRAMYNFSQALSGGYVKLIDWKSIELANMGTKEFKQQLIDSAVAMGTLTKQGDMYITSTGMAMNATKEFNNSLADGWMTSDVLTSTLGRYSDATTDIGKKATAAATDVKTFSQMISTLRESAGSGWSTTFETIFGGFEEGKTLWTQLNDTIGGFITRSADARNAMLGGWKEMGGREVLIQSFKDAFKALGEVVKPIKEAFRELFPKKTAGDLVILTGKISEFASKLKVSTETADKIKRTFAGVFSVFSIGIEIVKNIGAAIGAFFNTINGGAEGGGILNFTSGFGDMLVTIRKALVEGEGIKRFFTGIGEAAGRLAEVIGPVISKIFDLFSFEGAKDAGEGFLNWLSGGVSIISTGMDGLGLLIRGFGAAISWIKDHVGAVGDGFAFVVDAVKKVKQAIMNLLTPADAQVALAGIQIGFIGALVAAIKKGINVNFDMDIFDQLSEMLGSVTKTLKTMQTQIKANTLGKIAIAIGVLSASIMLLSTINPKKLASSMAAITAGFAELVGAMVVMDKHVKNIDPRRIVGLMGALIAMSGAVLILSFAVKNLSSIDPGNLATATAAVGAMLAMLVVTAKNFTSMSGAMIRTGLSLLLLSAAILVLAEAVEKLSEIDAKSLAKGLLGTVILLDTVTAAMAKVPPGLFGSAVGLIAMAIAINILILAIEKLGKFDLKELGIGLVAVTAGMYAMAMALAKVPPGLLGSALGLVAMALAIRIMVGAIKELGALDMEDLAKGIISVGLTLLLLVGAAEAMKGSLPGALAIGVMAGALILLTASIGVLGTLDLPTLAKGLGSLGIALGILALAANAMTGAIPGAAAMVIMALAVNMLVPALMALGQLDPLGLVIALAGLGGIFLVIGGAAKLLTPVIPAIFGLAAALGAVAAAIALFGAGVLMFANGMALLASSGEDGTKAFLGMIKKLLGAIPDLIGAVFKSLGKVIVAFFDMLPTIIKAVGKALDDLLKELIKLLPKAASAISTAVAGLITIIRENAPNLIKAGFELIVAFLRGLKEHISEIALLGADIIISLGRAIKEKIGALAEAAVSVVLAFISALSQNIPRLLFAAAELVKAFLVGLKNSVPGVAVAAGELIVAFLTALNSQLPGILQAAARLVVTFLTGLAQEMPKMIEAAAKFIAAFLKGLAQQMPSLITSAITLISAFLTSLASNAPKFIGAAAQLIASLLNGLAQQMPLLINAAANLIISFINSLVAEVPRIAEAGVNLLIALAQAIADNVFRILDVVVKMMIDLVTELGAHVNDIINAGAKVIGDFIAGIVGAIGTIVAKGAEAVAQFVLGLGNAAQTIVTAGGEAIGSFMQGLADNAGKIISKGVEAVGKFIEGLGANAKKLIKAASETILSFMEGLEQSIRDNNERFRNAAKGIASAIADGFSFGITGKIGEMVSSAVDAFGSVVDGVKSHLGINSPSKVFKKIGDGVIEGFALGVKDSKPAESTMKKTMVKVVSAAKKGAEEVKTIMEDVGVIEPQIVPVVDLREARKQVSRLNGLLAFDSSIAMGQARLIAKTSNPSPASEPVSTAPTTVNFNQTINSPKYLSTNDIYRNTKSQLALAREEIGLVK